ncbi:MAG: 2Fe-2S iron-sulfur cluster-binding protein, partial [Methyloligellaceae bacterium]
MVKLFKSLFGASGVDPKQSPPSGTSGEGGDTLQASEAGSDLVTVSMTVNGETVTGEVEARTRLVQFIRENLRLTGTHIGCDTSQCGACTIHMDG